MAYKTCPDCGSRIFEYGCVNCNEQDYIDMQDEDDNDKGDDYYEDKRDGTVVPLQDMSDDRSTESA